jgi:hypothetical protein
MATDGKAQVQQFNQGEKLGLTLAQAEFFFAKKF